MQNALGILQRIKVWDLVWDTQLCHPHKISTPKHAWIWAYVWIYAIKIANTAKCRIWIDE